MSEYYAWVNVDKKEYLDPSDYDCGSKGCESERKDCVLLRALHTLLCDR